MGANPYMYFTDMNILRGCNYDVIAADPAWKYQDTASAGERGACFKYPVLSAQDMAALPVGDIAARDSVLFMWTTGPMLVDGTAERLARAWGFTPKTMAFTWVKLTKLGKRWFWGMGRWTRSNPEFVVLYTKGKPSRVSAAVHSIIEAPIGEHSVKPAEYRDRIVALCGDVSRIELFARGNVEDGWDRWGNEEAGPRSILPRGESIAA